MSKRLQKYDLIDGSQVWVDKEPRGCLWRVMHSESDEPLHESDSIHSCDSYLIDLLECDLCDIDL